MSGELVSLRLFLVSESEPQRDLLRHGATLAAVPIEVEEADDPDAAAGPLARGDIDLLLIDATFATGRRAAAVAAARRTPRPPFVALVATSPDVDCGCGADGVVLMPRAADDARRLLDRLSRVKLPSRALLVDDSSTVRGIVRKVLLASRFPFEIAEAAEGGAALVQVRRAAFEIVFLDCNMPGLDGFATLAELRRDHAEIEVVMITAADDAGFERRARSAGAAFLKKPFFPVDIERVLCGYYGLHRLARPGDSPARGAA